MPASLDVSAEAIAALRRHVIDSFTTRCVDAEHGGFLVDFDARWQPVGPHHKTLEHVTRTTTAMALLDQRFPDEGFDDLARRGGRYLQEVMWDQEFGGFYASVERGGAPRAEGLKHPHANIYAVRCLLLLTPLLEPGESDRWIEQTLHWLDDVTWDPSHGGYWGTFTRDNRRYEAGARLPTSDGRDVFGVVPGFKELNTQSDAMEMQTSLLLAGSRHGSVDRLGWFADLVVGRLVHDNGILPYLYSPEWSPVAELARVGYHFIVARHLLTSLRWLDDDRLASTACLLTETALARGRHPDGGLILAMAEDGRRWPNSGGSNDLRQWWTQIEAIQILHLLSQSGEIDEARRADFLRQRDDLWRFFRAEYLDETYRGVREHPRPSTPSWKRQVVNRLQRRDPLAGERKGHGWKDPLHETVALLALSTEPVVAPD